VVASALESLDLHPGPWTEDEFLAQPPNPRVELLDGSLLVSPAGTGLHQWLSFQLCVVLNAAAPRGMRALEAVNVRVAPGRILIPDLTVLTRPDLRALRYPAAAALLVVEITSPGNAYVDRAVKPQLYAQAGIPSYLRVELERGEPSGLVFALDGDQYVETARFTPGETTRLDVPFPVEFDLAALVAQE
jgi:Uma2 family endonuclease